MTKKTLIVLALVFTGIIARAQAPDKIAVSLSVDANFPSENSIGGPGFTAKIELPLMSRLNLTLSAAYVVNYYGTRYYDAAQPPVCSTCTVPHEPEGPVNGGPYKFVPLKAGLRYYYLKHFYFEGEAGEAIKATPLFMVVI